MRPYAKYNRSPIACVSCRASKIRCVRQQNLPSCKRCKELALKCESEIKISQQSGLINKKIASPTSTPQHISPILPTKEFVVELVEIFFANQYQGIFPFIHRPSFLEFLKSDEFNPSTYIDDYNSKFFTETYSTSLRYPDPVLLLSILALCARLHSGISFAYGKFSEDTAPESFEPYILTSDSEFSTYIKSDTDLVSASNASKYFGWHARRYMKDVFDSPTVQRIQAFTLLSSHEWGEGNNSRSFLYIGIAARMALVLGLGNENTICDEDVHDKNLGEIVTESKRRTIWSVYMMDRCNSSGRQRSPAIRIEDIKVKLPSNENDFLFGNPNTSLMYDELTKSMQGGASGHSRNISMIGFTIVVFEIWAKIAKWVGEVGVKYEKSSPWLSESVFHCLRQDLDSVAVLLPPDFQLSGFNLKMHMELGTATHFGYFHGLFFICRIFLNREYLFCNPDSFPPGWWKDLTVQLLDSLESISSLVEELRSKDMMVIAPFTGFEVFTCAVTSFYFCAFPDEILLEHLPVEKLGVVNTRSDLGDWKFKYKKLALKNMDCLTKWTQTWELGRKWQKLSVNLGIIFGQLAANGSDEFNSDYLRHSMQDYGSGEVAEVYVPQTSHKKHDKSDMEIMRLLNKDSTPASVSEENSQEMSSGDFGVIELLSPPQFMFSTNSLSIYPGWNGSDDS
ncbi:hypothetical protein CANTEDRAFT_121804 [Yamadazyma tenuis ATCC 10573]|uniref:Zn(2)-C6 fungal-type domain-containing protein n=1 Tax=Candida tenuis (strain ATCC 10573 / BCRC 21748 / CBS 615 / JCM 9827 / NBRC 10315 / NRRL Y-1498 / VKM Y-70) TaxID=590646 RepID=G3B4A6_CANTC|nr:uncharacterized protein CANTEDRAFT_121804 [Yamadazyma tenuis ATCC 10573]XP_006686251.1 uncharacterized protein CANTEDRAFT_121804 [Yamadazyma tenuis ATCC 10573]EGV63936.1 hypothetical protein CANTEDRAFT_121804 [Yamadazyma tenuis ATCC 10573]EGV63937.1 hypothetical protein CANTEDRAFT_121804 [Yamadazyma tenuis ATCC 10573]